MAIGRISGQMLKANLLRSGTDLAFETNLLVLDVTNSFVGVGTATPSRQLHISGTGALRLPSGTDAQRGTAANGDIRYNSDQGQIEGYVAGAWTDLGSGSTITDADGNTGIDVERSADENQIHFFIESVGDVAHIRSDGAIELNNLEIDNQTITGLTTNGDIALSPNGDGNVNLNADTVRVGDSNANATITTQGTGDLILNTNAGSNSGSITIADGTNGNIDITPNGTGEVNITKVDIDGGAIDGTTIGASSAAAGTFTSITGTSLSVGDGDITNVGDIDVDTVSADNGTDFDLVLADNQATALEIKEAGNAYMTFVTTDAAEQITVAKKLFISNGITFESNTVDINGGAIDGTTIGANSAAAGTFTNLTANGVINIDGDGTGDNIDGVIIGANLAASGKFTTIVVNELSSDDSTAIQINEALNVSGAVTASAFDARDGNITNVGDIALDSISADNSTDFDITLADNQANALEIKEAGNSYLNFATTNSSELITAGQAFTVATGKTFTTDTADINGGAIDGTTIGANSAAAGTFSNLTANGTINIDGDGTGDNIDGVIIGANLAAAGTFTTVDTSGNVTVGGNLTVNGVTTTIESTTLQIEDPLLTLAKNNSGGSVNTYDQGLLINRGSATNQFIGWDESDDEFAVFSTSDTGSTSGNINLTAYADFAAKDVYADKFVATGITIEDNNITATQSNDNLVLTPSGTGSVVINGTTTFGGAVSFGDNNITNVGDINVDSVSSDNGTDFAFLLDDNQSAALTIKEGSTAYMTFVTTDAAEQITVAKKLFISNGITFESNTVDINGGAIDGAIIGANSAAAGTFTSLTGTSLSVSDGDITNVGDINVDSVSSDNGTDFDILLDDNNATALEIKEAGNAYMTFVTTDAGEQITVAKKLLVSNGITFESNTVDINGGAIDGTTIGANSAAAGTFTNVVLNELSSADSSAIQINDSVNVSGTLNAKTLITNDISSEDSTTIQINDSLNVSGTLTAKTLDVNELFSSDSSAIQISDGLNVSGTTTANTFLSSNVTLTGGNIDGTVIGATTKAAGNFTTVDTNDHIVIGADSKALKIGASGDLQLSHDGTDTTISNATGILKINGAATSSININAAAANVDTQISGDTDAELIYVDASADKIGISTATPAYILDIASTDAVRLPGGDNASRPTAATGVIRFNTSSSAYEGSTDGSTWSAFAMGGGGVAAISKVSATGDGSTSTFTGFFASTPESAANVMVYIDNVYQEPTENYTVSSNNITFTSAPHSGARIFALVGFDAGSMTTGGISRTQTDSVSFTSADTAIMTFNATSYRSAELFVTVTDAGNTEYACMKANVVHDGTTAFISVYGIVNTGGSDTATLTATLSGGTVTVSAISTGGASSAQVQYSLQSV
jgi:hypothetical protein